jgi:hypothetical protein
VYYRLLNPSIEVAVDLAEEVSQLFLPKTILFLFSHQTFLTDKNEVKLEYNLGRRPCPPGVCQYESFGMQHHIGDKPK